MVQKKKKNPKITFFILFKKQLLPKKMLISYFSNIRRTRFNQSSPVRPISESKGVPWAWQSLEVEGRKSACLILDVIKRVIKWLAKTGFHGVFAGGKWTSTGPTQWKRENVTLPKHQHVGCLSRGNSLECWRCAPRLEDSQIWDRPYPGPIHGPRAVGPDCEDCGCLVRVS